MTVENLPPVLSVEEAAEVLGVSAWTVYDLRVRGILPVGVWFQIGARIKVNTAELLAWSRAGGTALNDKNRQRATRQRKRQRTSPRGRAVKSVGAR